ncbi:MAG: DUF1993 domain-containing protein [Pseudomonadota bacterium]
MSTSLYDLSVSSYLQSVAGVAEVMKKGRAFAVENNLSLDSVVETRLVDDMLPFRFQIMAVVHQSIGAIHGIHAAEFGPPKPSDPLDYDGLMALLATTMDELQAVDPDTINTYAGKPVTFKMGELQIPFSAENFVLSFSLPNLYFHATTAYDMLRELGVPLSKRDFLGNLRVGV